MILHISISLNILAIIICVILYIKNSDLKYERDKLTNIVNDFNKGVLLIKDIDMSGAVNGINKWNESQIKYLDTIKDDMMCPKCHVGHLIRDTSTTYTSLPEKHLYYCEVCKSTTIK